MKEQRFISILSRDFNSEKVIKQINLENPLTTQIKFLSEEGIASSKELAIEILKKKEIKNNEAISVAYVTKNIENQKKPKKIRNLEQEAIVKRKEYECLENEEHFKNAKNPLITCKYCKSRINKDFLLNNNYCPACKKDMRPNTTIKRINKAKEIMLKKEEKLKIENSKWESSLPERIAWMTRYDHEGRDP